MTTSFAIVVPWHNPVQRDAFLTAWGMEQSKAGSTILPDYLFLQRDETKAGCAKTKNAGIRRALDSGAEMIIVLDDDCYPAPSTPGQTFEYSFQDFAAEHAAALRPQPVRMVFPTTMPNPRGMPYRQWTIETPVAASIGMWLKNPDLDAITTLLMGPTPETQYFRRPFFHQYFPFSGMNFAFRREWAECAQLIDVPRFDDIWMGWVWEKIAYDKGFCFNLAGPLVNHSRQSNVWRNLDDEAKYLSVNEGLWSAIHNTPAGLSADYIRAKFFAKFIPPVNLAPVGTCCDATGLPGESGPTGSFV